MPNKCDADIYGHDDTGYASKVASDALSGGHGDEDFHGSTFDQSARAKGNKPDEDIPTKATNSNKSDSRAKSKGND